MCYFKLAKLDENATWFDKIAAAAHQKFNTLAATVMESMVGRKVMAAVVMTSDQISFDNGCVISLATGQQQSINEIVHLYDIKKFLKSNGGNNFTPTPTIHP